MKGLFKKLFQPEEAPFITVVSGLPRSGTSMLMKMLEAGGIPPLTDNLRAADTDNPKGYYEFERVKQMDKGDVAWLPEAQGKAVKVISALLRHLPADYAYRVLFVRRSMPEILASQRKMLIRRGEDPNKMDDARMADLFEKHLQQVESWLSQQSHMQALYLHYSDFFADSLAQVTRVNAFLGAKLNTEAMLNVVDPDLYRNRERRAAG
jgi:hypothetical protein